ncbi:hypothetical protein [Microlunatus flavus]|uniref:Uncharacterized protein n=1 Tax=Microlunatus flavus TaxID=1036181 RepID=A0A1H9JBB7_9ACTN|nr:hypothetical protein [Microlunatus flavus]SEQ84077.1 hypothetical protein SAMN05421756_106148 [Microlunatus flavus]
MTTLVPVLLLVVAVTCVAIPLTAVAAVYRDELRPLGNAVRRAVAFDPRHPAFGHLG